jgi:glycosyltransferase involved in cell wall biosynthesis
LKILFLSFYFAPDLSAGSFRAEALVKSLIENFPEQVSIEIVAALPNRYNSYVPEAPEFEQRDNIIIRRIRIPNHSSGMLDQVKAYTVFAREALRISRNKKYDLIYATSSRLMTATLGAYISDKVKSPLYLDIRDIFVDTIKDVLPKKISPVAKAFFSIIERWTIHKAERVNLVSAGFLGYFQDHYPEMKYDLFTNGIDPEFIAAQPLSYTRGESEVLSVVYAGNIGEGQGLHNIIPGLAQKLRGRLNFKLIGDGGRKQQLESALYAAGCQNVEIIPPMNRDDLINFYQAADILLLHLNDHDAFRKVLPSKIFEYAAVGKPIWAGVAGYAADFIKNNIPNASIFIPCDVNGAVEAFGRLELVTRPRHEFVETFSRASIMEKMANTIIGSARNKNL